MNEARAGLFHIGNLMAVHAQNEGLRSIGNWDLVEKIADSGMGMVYKARNRADGDVVVVKIMPPFHAAKEQAFQRFARECRILSALNDPCVVRALDFGIDGSDPYLVMEFVEGESLAQRIARESSLPEGEAVRLITQVAGALSRAHRRGLVHRNVKPGSILITADGQAKLTGFDLAKEAQNQGLTRVGTLLGTPNFMAPEQFFNASKATPSCDVYSLGATLYMAVTGVLPFDGCEVADMLARKLRNDLPPPREPARVLSERTEWVIRRAMSPHPDQRLVTCGELIEKLTDNQFKAAPADVERRDGATADSASSPASKPAAGAPAQADDSAQVPAASTNGTMGTAHDDQSEDGSPWMKFLAMSAAAGAAFVAGLYLLSHLL
jgi:serine/threonine protein kinase